MKSRSMLRTNRCMAILTLTLALVAFFAPAVGAVHPADTQPVIEHELPAQPSPEVQPLEQQLAEDPVADAQEMRHVPCIQVIVWAKNPGTGECVQFPTPCDAPAGWEIFFTLEDCLAA